MTILSRTCYVEIAFYTPIWKTGRVMPWQCPFVQPFVRPRFPDFSSTCFEISIWNLMYTFSRWHDMSSLSCITIGLFWPSLQPKVGQTHFFCNRGLINQDKFFNFCTQVACCILLDISSVFYKNIIFGILEFMFVRFGFFLLFRAFFYMFWDISLKLGI